MNGSPNRWLVELSPFDTMILVSRHAYEISGLQLNHSILKSQLSRSFEHNDPFMLTLVIPEIFRGSVAVRDDPFDTQVSGVVKSPSGKSQGRSVKRFDELEPVLDEFILTDGFQYFR